MNRKILVLEKKVEQLDEYLFHYRTLFTIEYTLDTSPFFTRALEEVSLTQGGEYKSYKQTVNSSKNNIASRAVANANAHNTIPIFIQCHREIKLFGELGGYKGGVGHNKYLLNLGRKTGNFRRLIFKLKF